ncbi:MAG: hypothetical protein P8X70_00050 [Nanoarchaeota archaeon]
MTEQKIIPEEKMNFKIFDLYDISEIKVEDPGLKDVINLEPKLILKNYGRNSQRFGQAKVNIVERLINKIAVAGHRGKKHKIAIGHTTGKYSKNVKIILEAFRIIEKRTQKNPVLLNMVVQDILRQLMFLL